MWCPDLSPTVPVCLNPIPVCLNHVLICLIFVLDNRTGLAWDSIGNSNWYVFGIIGEYLIFLVSYSIFCRKNIQDSKFSRVLSLALTFYLTVAFVKWLRYMGRPSYCYNTLMMFPLGVLLANLKKSVVIWTNWTCLLSTLIIYRISFPNRFLSLKWYTVWTTAFMVICIILSTRIRVDGWLIRFCSSHVFSIYILQRLPMNILSYMGWMNKSPYMSFLICAIATGLIAVIFDSACSWIMAQSSYLFKNSLLK